jgi:tetratricopeptide (TPR) repeat protein
MRIGFANIAGKQTGICMSEGMLGGVLGDEDEKPEIEVPDTLAGAEAFAAAVAAKLSGNDPGVARRTEEFLIEQTQLLKVQKQHLSDEHALRLAHLRNQLREENVRRIGLRLRVAFQLFLVLVATVIGVGVAIMIRDAVTSRSVVVESFDAPPALAERGSTGKVVATSVLDELNRLQGVTRTTAVKRDLSNAWSSEVKLAVPETGVSIGELSRLLKARFGHDLHINGDLVQTERGGLALTVRGDGITPKTFPGSSADLSMLTTAAAEYIYAQSEPAPWAYYLQNSQRNDEAIGFCRDRFASADKADRPYLLNVWANALAAKGAPVTESLELYRSALRLKPDYWVAYNNVMNSLWDMGDEEGAWHTGNDMLAAAGGRPGRAPEILYENLDALTWNLGPWLNATIGDVDAGAGTGSTTESSAITVGDIQARLHDSVAAELALQTTKEDPNDPTIAAIGHFVRGRLAADAGDATQAAAEMEAFAAAYPNPAVSAQYPGYNCWIAPVEEAAGHREKADAAVKAGGKYVDCYRFRADILDGRGDWSGAQKAYADAVALAQDLPAGYYSWGVALTRHGDLAGAESKLKDANQRGPHWADPLKALGDVLMKQGHAKEALARYDEALKYAPNWKQLSEARRTAANKNT